MTERILTVSEVNREINDALKKHNGLWNCWVTGEISNFKDHIPSGHWYFTLKDKEAGIKTVMFKTRNLTAGFQPQNGMKVSIRGSIRLYEKDGSVQLYAEEIYPSGLGALYLAFEQLKSRLAAEGLFAAEKKKPIPRFPSRVAIVTSSTGAALKDILHIARRRNPLVSLIIIPSAVQGEAAPGEIARAIQRANHYGEIDLLIVGRGGGSLEELWAFNTEEVARAIAASSIPVVSAVGHEVDYTIADFVADLRAPTPSAAAELVIPVLNELKDGIRYYEEKLTQRIQSVLRTKRHKVEELMSNSALARPGWRVEQSRQNLDYLSTRLVEGMTGFLTEKNGILRLLSAKIDLLSPLNILGRGYSLAYDIEGKLIKTVRQAAAGDALSVRLSDGTLICEVTDIEELQASNDSNVKRGLP
ncbi:MULTISPECIES: exodeoxyribonuclease VII large subunit [Dehalobacter]|uniref:Exodeoxyribonuclease 7 large subunit n=2 Tax=Dehalobacter restrictus TaxID=55583 RepID=A0A857DJ55_9FIRM|nr:MULTISPECIES: exodeoxyribonuclease VII large subunit [Dehalobacter]AHF09798.1 exodeoxyribonuclease VII large subunit [Dehalobacter restrictus DSM 9455]MCG1026086.1 exodeoxyribonuclease VII large subunit [Dehalobacter sp.]MDJ0305013.1 exodeoxyribonuclease VII large subunit [Dehalobacter sp.]OCZ53423.1 exodeoxyribonuclease VII large subunit [Dehalobacter sp. TeCB1]QHA00385.1 exodeoxyribonuclease VII large subunit [Dehalobacter restrictus]